MIDDKTSVELILKIQVPHMGILKTVRTNTGHKVASLVESLVEKLETAEKQDFSQFGLYWYSETGPLWLSDNSYVRSYGLKNGDTLQYKQKPVIVAGPTAAAAVAAAAAATAAAATAATSMSTTSDSANKKSSATSSPRSRTKSSPHIALPSLPSSPAIKSPRELNPKSPRDVRKSAKGALLKAFHLGGESKHAASQPSQVPPPPSHPYRSRAISVSSPLQPTKSFHQPTPVVIPEPVSGMQKSMSTPSPTSSPHRPHAATAPPRPVSQLSLSAGSVSERDDVIVVPPHNNSPTIHPHVQPPPPSPTPQPPSSASFSHSYFNALPRMPSQSPQLPPLYRGPTSDARNNDSVHACTCERNKAPCAHLEDLERTTAFTQKLTQRIELTECILTDTLQAIDEGEANLQAVKMYLTTALASLKREDLSQISFGK